MSLFNVMRMHTHIHATCVHTHTHRVIHYIYLQQTTMTTKKDLACTAEPDPQQSGRYYSGSMHTSPCTLFWL